ncbi:hypothetical protein, partial [Streptomyces sp. IBSBF 3136]|uniref:hypothetical protein n=1 Tax=Streptomyces sp. IBSBF 3136 TaxID=2903524 RepID=UPI002FDC446B
PTAPPHCPRLTPSDLGPAQSRRVHGLTDSRTDGFPDALAHRLTYRLTVRRATAPVTGGRVPQHRS